MSWISILHKDLHDLDPSKLAGKADVVVTSPPYKRKDGWNVKLRSRMAHVIAHALKPGGRAFINFGQLREDFAQPSELHVNMLRDTGLKSGQTIAWVKSLVIDGKQRGHYQPLNSNKLLNYCWEPIYTFYKPPEPDFDRLSIGVPYADKTNLKRGTRGKHGDLHCGGDVWFLPYSTTGSKTKKKHAYEFPEALVERCLLVSGVKPGGTVLDPFCGSGTTAAVARRLGLNAITIDMVEENLTKAQARWEATRGPDQASE